MYIRKPHNIRELFLNKVLSYQPLSIYVIYIAILKNFVTSYVVDARVHRQKSDRFSTRRFVSVFSLKRNKQAIIIITII